MIEPREFVLGSFQTKEQQELGRKVDELIIAVNELLKKKEKHD